MYSTVCRNLLLFQSHFCSWMTKKKQLQEDFGRVMKGLRNERNLSQVELAERGGFNSIYKSDLEKGIKQTSLLTILSPSNDF